MNSRSLLLLLEKHNKIGATSVVICFCFCRKQTMSKRQKRLKKNKTFLTFKLNERKNKSNKLRGLFRGWRSFLKQKPTKNFSNLERYFCRCARMWNQSHLPLISSLLFAPVPTPSFLLSWPLCALPVSSLSSASAPRRLSLSWERDGALLCKNRGTKYMTSWEKVQYSMCGIDFIYNYS